MPQEKEKRSSARHILGIGTHHLQVSGVSGFPARFVVSLPRWGNIGRQKAQMSP